MKKLGLILTALMLSVLTISAYAQDEYTKEFNKEYSVNKDATLKLENKFGDINLEVWNKNQVEIKVIISVYDMSQKRSEDLMDEINVRFSGTKSMVSAVTEIGKLGKGHKEFSIDYYVKLPNTLKLDLYNKYGNVYVPTYEGATDLTVKYGGLTVDKLLNSRNDIVVKYGELSIDELKEAKVHLGYSDLSIDRVEILDLNTSYSDVSIDVVSDLELKTSFDNVEIDEVVNLSARSSYSELEIDRVLKELEIEGSFGDIEVGFISKDFTNVDIDSDYTSVELEFENGAAFEIEVYTKYGEFYSDFRTKMDREKLSFNSYKYTGTVGNPSNQNVKIKSSFASIEIK